jgi:hypothetical protein
MGACCLRRSRPAHGFAIPCRPGAEPACHEDSSYITGTELFVNGGFAQVGRRKRLLMRQLTAWFVGMLLATSEAVIRLRQARARGLRRRPVHLTGRRRTHAFTRYRSKSTAEPIQSTSTRSIQGKNHKITATDAKPVSNSPVIVSIATAPEPPVSSHGPFHQSQRNRTSPSWLGMPT